MFQLVYDHNICYLYHYLMVFIGLYNIRLVLVRFHAGRLGLISCNVFMLIL